MEESNSDIPSKDSDINPPPIKLPPPDPFDTRKSNEGNTSFDKRGRSQKKKKQKKGRTHPTDRYQDVRREKKGMGCCGGIGCLALVILLLIVGGVGAGGWVLFGDMVGDGYAIVQLDGAEEVISTAPTTATLYLAPKSKVIYNAPQTQVPLTIVARQINVSGDFLENLNLRGGVVTCQSGTRCRMNLDVYAFQYVDEGIRVDGEKKGKTYQ